MNYLYKYSKMVSLPGKADLKRAFSGFRLGFAALLLVSLIKTSGVDAAAMSGPYTIGPSGNYTSFTLAVSALTTNGVSGPVVFSVASGTFTEAITIGSITGASSTNTITFKGAGRLITTLTSAAITVTLNSSKYILFDNMTLTTTATSNYVFKNTTDVGCGITNCNVQAGIYSSATVYLVYSTNTTQFLLTNDRLVGGYYSWYNYGTSGGSTTLGYSTCTNNRFISEGYCGIYAVYPSGCTYTNNVFDSAGYASMEYGSLSEYESGCTWNNNQFKCHAYYGFLCELDNYYAVTINSKILQCNFVNNIISGGYTYGCYYLPENAPAGCISVFAHNTIYSSGCTYGLLAEMISNATGTQIFANNIVIALSPTTYGIYMYVSPAAQVAVMDGNDLYSAGGGNFAYFYNGSAGVVESTYSAYLTAVQATNPAWEAHGANVIPPFLNMPSNLLLDTTKSTPSGVSVGVLTDIRGRARCTLFPTTGAMESPFGKSKPIVKFYIPSNAYPGSPTTFFQTGKIGEPKVHKWYLQNSTYSNLTLLSTAVNFTTSALTLGTNCIKLVTYSCGGNDSFQTCFTVSSPTAVPNTDFIASQNTIQQGNNVQFTDISTNGPTKWLWQISPDSTYSNGVKVPTTTQYIAGLNTTQSPNVQFNFPGYYKVCLTTYNGIGKGPTACKTNYINVVPAVNLSNTPQQVSAANGYLYDNGGPNGNYVSIAAPYLQSILITPCADSVYLTFSSFDTYCGADFVRIYSGTNKGNGIPLWNSLCSGIGTSGYGPGYTGGPTHNTCAAYCVPNVTKPDTFRAGPAMYIEMICYNGSAPGFAAYWWSKHNSSKPPAVSFKTSNASDSVCVNQVLNFTNTTQYPSNDVPTFEWDLDGSISDGFECVGTCATALWPYFLPGTVPVTLIGIGCGGADTAIQYLTVYNPPKPKTAFSADNTSPTTNDIVFLSSNVVQCVDDYKWTITKNTTGSSGSVAYLNGTTPISANPQINIVDTGYFNVKLYIDNASGSQKDSLTKTKYIQVRNAYCIPNVASRVAGIGMTSVVFNTINNSMLQAQADYINYVPNTSLSTNIAVGATYKLTLTRDPNTVYDAINRDVWIDWNQDGSFSGAGETVLKDSNSTSLSYTANVKVPKTAKLGATVMRVATNLNVYANQPCGQNQFGAYQDYRVYVTPYNILPVITLKGHHGLTDTIKVEQGYPYSEPGDSASSYLYGNITSSIVVTSKPTFNAIVPGTYVFTYNVSDSAGNKAITQYRVVKITPDKTAPTLVVNTPDTTYIEVTKLPQHPLPIPKVISANDLVDGNLISSVTIDTSKLTTNILGTYAVTYSVSDLSNNVAKAVRYVIVIDTLKPLLTLNGAAIDTVEVYTSYVETGVAITDNYYTASQLLHNLVITSNVDTSHLGIYKVTYSLKDPSGNTAVTVVRKVIVADKIAPTLTLNGPKVDSVAVFTPYVDKGVSVSDNYDHTIVPVRTGTFYTNFPGGTNPNVIGTAYTIVYTATDQSGNSTTVTRIVKVQDRTAPVIALKGDVDVSVCRWFKYVDAGYTVSDNYDKIANLTIDTMGTFFTNGGTTMENSLYLFYSATDKSGNTGYSGYRNILVNPSTYFECQSGIAPNLSLDQSIKVFPNPGTGVFTMTANMPAQVKAKVSVTNMLGQEIAVVFNGVLGQNSYRIDLSSQASGIYLLNIVTDNQTITKRIEIAK